MTQPIYERREVSDFKDLINQSVNIYGNEDAFWLKNFTGEYEGITYKSLKKDIDALGTEFINMGLRHESIAVISENRYEWCLTYLATTCGTGTIVPLDKELSINEIRLVLEYTKVKCIVFSDKVKEKIFEAIKGNSEIKYLVNIDLEEDKENCLSFSNMLKKGNNLLKIGDKKFFNSKVEPDEQTIYMFSFNDDTIKETRLSQRNICSDIVSILQIMNIDSSDSILSILPLTNIYECVFTLLLMLYSGGKISFGEGNLITSMKEVKPTIMVANPYIYLKIYENIFDTARKTGKLNALKGTLRISQIASKINIDIQKKLFQNILENFGGKLRLAISGGGIISPKMLKILKDMGLNIFQSYGMNSTSSIVFINKEENKYDSIGIPLPGVEVKIENTDKNGVGDIFVKGPMIGDGFIYTKENNIVLKNSDGWLKTGDVGYKDKNDFYYVLNN